MGLLETYQLDKNNIPTHVAVIMDGNGRWAKKQGIKRIFGHQSAVKAVRETVEAAAEIGVKFLTLYAFSTENWQRPQAEVDALMNLLVSSLKKELPTLQKNQIRLKNIGQKEKLPEKCVAELEYVMQQTQNNQRMDLVLALSYGARQDMISAINQLMSSGIYNINEEIFQQYLSTKEIPNPDLLIRTSGEYRISNFLLWEMAYTELYFTEVLWPDFRKEDFAKAILAYQQRERRFGKTSEQLQK